MAYSLVHTQLPFYATSPPLPRVGNTHSGPGPFTSKSDKENAPQASVK